jgi:type I restriction enzyme S subunit
MNTTKIKDVCVVVSGTTPKSTEKRYWNGTHVWITPAELTEDSFIVSDSERHITDEAVKATGLKPFPKGTVLLSSRAPIGKVAIAGCDMYCNQGFKNLICSDSIYNLYLYYFLKSKTEYLNSLGRGATFKEISKGIVEDITIPFPAYDEQIHIAKQLQKITELIALKKRQYRYLDDIIRSRFLELFGDPLAGNAKWPIHNLCMVADAIDPQPSHRTPPIDKNGIPYISIKDCDYNTGKIDFEKARKVNVKVLQEHKTRYQIHNGDMMIGKIGTIGYPVFLPTYETYTLSANVILIQPNKSKVQPCFLKYSLESPYVESQFDKAKHSTSQSAFGILKIRKIKVMNPELSIQNQFADFVNQVDKSKYRGTISLHLLEDVSHML